MKGRLLLSAILALAIVALSSFAASAQTGIDRKTYVPGGQGDFPFAHAAFKNLWSRNDLPYKENKIERAWFWGPGANSVGLLEPYNNDATGAQGQRRVQYFDKSRMEINNPNADCSNPFNYVTNGLLSVELIAGQIQVGTNSYSKGNDACLSMVGDANDTLAPTYFAFRSVSNTRAGNHPALDRTGQRPTETLNRAGVRGTDPSKGVLIGTEFVHYENQHNMPRVFWEFLHETGPVYVNADTNQIAVQPLVEPWFYVSGLPISEPYWAKATIRGIATDVLIQAYERVIFTFTPTNRPGWQVEMGNIGQHYFTWRYSTFGLCPGATPVRVQSPVLAPQSTTTCGPVSTPTPTRSVVPPATNTPGGTPPPNRTPTPTSIRTNTPTVRPLTSTPTSTTRLATATPTSPPTFTVTPTTRVEDQPTRVPTRTYTREPTEPPTRIPTDTPEPTAPLPKTKTPTRTR